MASTHEIDFANGLVFQVRDKGTLVPVLLRIDSPNSATQIDTSQSLYKDLGVDKVAIVHYDESDEHYTLQHITDVVMLRDGDSTTAKKALDIIVSQGRLLHFVNASLDLE